ncbi:MAG: hypothetical protein LLG24_07870, partial [Actinomycetia bacterium]|nr:hypothetical protein [Actinomycetes bacterium]
RVLGEFSAVSGVIPLAVIEQAQSRSLEPRAGAEVVIGVDVARSTDKDESVIASRMDKRIRIEDVLRLRDIMPIAGRVVQIASGYRSLGHPVRVVVDTVGLGAGVADRLRELGLDVEDFNAAERAIEPDRYPNRRSEAWYTAAELLKEMDLDPDDMLAADLSAPKGSVASSGRLVVEGKDETRRRLGRSPDRADAVLMTLLPPKPKYAYAV